MVKLDQILICLNHRIEQIINAVTNGIGVMPPWEGHIDT